MSFCLFHLGQNVYRHIVQEGFKVCYHEDDSFSIKLRSFISLAFLPTNEVDDAFEELLDDDDIPQPFVSYIENTYTGPVRGRGNRRRRLDPKFSIESWNVLGRCLRGESRTINNLEAFHSALVKIFSSNHPNIGILIEALKSEDGLAKTKLQKLKQGEEVLQKKKYRDCNMRILHLVQNFDPAKRMDFLKAIAHNMILFIFLIFDIYIS